MISNKKLKDISLLRNENIKESNNEKMLYITTTNMLSNKKGIDYSQISNLKNSGKAFHPDDILISNIRPYYKKIWLASKEGISSNDILRIVPKDGVSAKYLYYLLCSDYFFDYMTKTSKGTKMPRGDKEAIKAFPVPNHSLEVQNFIAELLSSFDDKIENNNKIINNLEEQAQAIFKSWFVDFEPFQDEDFIESKLGKIPNGWKVTTIEAVSQSIITGKTPSTKEATNYGKKMPFITIPDMHNKAYVVETERYLSEKGISSQKGKTLPKNSIIVSCIATVGLVSLVSKESQTNQQINAIIAKNNISPYYLYEYLTMQYNYLNAIGSSGSTTKNINKNTFSKLTLLYPEQEVLSKFHKICKQIFECVLSLQKQNIKLRKARDELLPKLMSGEIRVNEAEEMI